MTVTVTDTPVCVCGHAWAWHRVVDKTCIKCNCGVFQKEQK